LIKELLELIGEDPTREGLIETPARVAQTLLFLTKGYQQDVEEILEGALFEDEGLPAEGLPGQGVPLPGAGPAQKGQGMVILRDIDVYSLCEHHLLPFFGKCHVAYIPDGKIIGLSKIPRLVEVFSRRLQVQERLTHQIAGALWEALDPKGVAVVIEAYHLCMMMRGVREHNALVTTSALYGVFRNDPITWQEFMSLIGQRPKP